MLPFNSAYRARYYLQNVHYPNLLYYSKTSTVLSLLVQKQQSQEAVLHLTNLPLLPINGWVCADGSNRRSHVLQVPHLDGAIVTSRHNVVSHGEHSWCHGAERNERLVNKTSRTHTSNMLQSLFNSSRPKISSWTNAHGFHEVHVRYLYVSLCRKWKLQRVKDLGC